ncbi:MAG: alpha/beta hydrolase [Rhodobacter sp.]|nr:alpha/beta hydrolase [Rhodobacter sp.]
MDLTDAYENAAYIPGADAYPEMWAAKAAAFREDLRDRARCDLTYGPLERNRYDMFLPEGAPAGLVMFIHGGYWRRFDKSLWSHLAAGPLAWGFAVAMPSYTLAPQAQISSITSEIATVLAAVAAEVPGPVVVTGHSAGGHLSARMRCRDVGLPGNVARRIRRVVPISPVSDLRPLLQTAINDDLRLDAAEAEAESPVSKTDLWPAETVVWVGADERPAFLDQARWLAEAWPESDLRIAPGRHHFDVIEELGEADSPLTQALLDGVA